MEENKNNGNGTHFYVMISMLILVVVGGLIVVSQNMDNIGEYFQGALRTPTTNTTTKTITPAITTKSIESTTNIDLEATVIDLQQRVIELEKFNTALLKSYDINNEFTCSALMNSGAAYATNLTTCQSRINLPLGNL